LTDLTETALFTEATLKEWDTENQITCTNLPILRPKYGNNQLMKTFDLKKFHPHFELFYNITLYKIDEWNGGNLKVFLEEKLEIYQTYSSNSKKICGNSKVDEIFVLSGKVFKTFIFRFKNYIKLTHNSANLKIQIISSDSSLSFGIRSVFLTLSKCHITCASCSGPLETDCGMCFPNFNLKDGKCVIFDKFYYETSPNDLNPSVVARMCRPSCVTCKGGGINDCLSCFDYGELKDGACIYNCTEKIKI
jgi:hypothetical protein